MDLVKIKYKSSRSTSAELSKLFKLYFFTGKDKSLQSCQYLLSSHHIQRQKEDSAHLEQQHPRIPILFEDGSDHWCLHQAQASKLSSWLAIPAMTTTLSIKTVCYHMGLIHTEAESSTPPHIADYTDYYANWCIFGQPGRSWCFHQIDYISPYNIRGLTENNHQLKAASKFHNIMDPIFVPITSLKGMVLLREMFTFKCVCHFEGLKITLECSPNHETYHLAGNGCSGQLMIGDFRCSLSSDLDYMEHLQDPHGVSGGFLCGLQDEGILIDSYRNLHPYDLSYTWRIYNSQENHVFANQILIGGVKVMKHFWNQSNLSDYAMISILVDSETIRVRSIFKCPSELHLDIKYQLIECQPESETKQNEKACRNFSWRNRDVSRANIGGQIFSVALNLLSEAPLNNATIMTLLLSTKVLLSKLSTHLKSRHVLNKLFEACCSLPEDDESNSIMSRVLTLFKAQSGMPCISFLHITLIIL